MRKRKTIYVLEYYDRKLHVFIPLWTGYSLDLGIRLASKSYNNRPWMGRKRLTKVVEEIIPLEVKKKNAQKSRS